MKPFARADRVSGLIHRVVADILRKEVKDPRIRQATISGVRLSRDLKNARIYFTVSGGEPAVQKALSGFESALGYIKRTLAAELELRYMPQIRFYYDDSFDYGARIDSVLKSVLPDNEEHHTTTETD